jgi:predicted dehydrogenase
MSIQAMEAGKHVASEVPAGFSLEKLEQLVRVKEATGKRYLLLENYIYSRANMLVLALATSGRLGEPYYAESSYIHDCRFMLFKEDGSLDWWGEWCTRNYGNDYPTHGLGPVSKWLGIHEGDRMERCSSFMTAPRVLERYAAKRFGPESPQGKLRWAQGEFTSTLIRTARGKVIRTDYDCNSPRPMSIYSLLQGTSGVFDSRSGIYFEDDADERWRPIEAHFAKDDHPEWRRHGEEALRTGHGGGDWFVLRDALEMVRQDRDPWIDVYDAAHWSSIYALSRKSIDADGTSVEIPDFTRGRWKTPGWRKDSMRPS